MTGRKQVFTRCKAGSYSRAYRAWPGARANNICFRPSFREGKLFSYLRALLFLVSKSFVDHVCAKSAVYHPHLIPVGQ